MIARIHGQIVEVEDKAVIVETNGLGYRVAIGATTLATVATGQEVTLYIYHHISAEAQNLYGFLNKEEQRYFELLLSVPSVGPRTARNILDIAPPKVLQRAVISQDVTLLTNVSGVGKKTAQRILIELKGKLGETDTEGAETSVQHETVEALISIGFSPAQARTVTQQLPKDIETVEEAVKEALKQRQ